MHLAVVVLISAATKTVLLDQCATTLQAAAPDGSAVYVHVVGKGIVKCNLLQTKNGSTLPNDTPPFLENTAGVQMLDVSPSGAYLLTWERLYAETCPRNLKVWCSQTGKRLAAWPQKSLSRESWPYLQWTVDERFAFLLVGGNQVRVYAAADILAERNDQEEPRFTDKVQVPGCATLSLPQQAAPAAASTTAASPATLNRYYLTTFSPKTKNQPGTASVYEWSPAAASPAAAAASKFNRLAVKSLFQAESCTTHWSPTSSLPSSSSLALPACLLTMQTAVDTTGESYYGSSQLLLWNTQTASGQEILSVPLPQAGPVQAVHWLPNPDKPASFIAVAGKTPPMASQHHGVTGAVTFLFGNNVHRNTVAPSPHARFACLAGLGNLAGGLGFWDLNKQKLLPHVVDNTQGTLRAEAVTMHSWSPDSRYFLVATTAPRMNVDNGLRVYKYTGELLVDNDNNNNEVRLPWRNSDYQPNHLLEACFVPALPGIYPDRPQSPVPERNSSEDATTTATPAAAAAPAAAGRYVPPSARNRAGGSSLAERLRREKEGNLQGATKVTKTTPVAAATVAGGRVIPGLSTVGAAAAGKSKSQLKREKLKKKKEQEEQEQVPAAAAAANP